MNKFKDVSYVALILLTIALLIEFYFMHERDEHDDTLKNLDYNQDGKVSRSELKRYLMWLEAKKRKNSMSTMEFKTSIVSGLSRGLLMGLILFDMEGGVVLGIILGLLNPVITGLTKLALY